MWRIVLAEIKKEDMELVRIIDADAWESKMASWAGVDEPFDPDWEEYMNNVRRQHDENLDAMYEVFNNAPDEFADNEDLFEMFVDWTIFDSGEEIESICFC